MADILNDGHEIMTNRNSIPFTSDFHKAIEKMEKVFLTDYENNPSDDKIRKLGDRGIQTKNWGLEITEWANINNGVGFSNSLTDEQKHIKDVMLKQENVIPVWESNVLKVNMPNKDGTTLSVGIGDLQEISGQIIPHDIQLDVDTTALNVKEAAEQDTELWDQNYTEKLKRSINITPNNITRIFWDLKLGNGSTFVELLQDHPDFNSPFSKTENEGKLELSNNDRNSIIKNIGTKDNLTKNFEYWSNEIKNIIVNGLFKPNWEKGKKLSKKRTKPSKYVG